ncbi:MAG: phosphoglycerate mutase family protein [Gammaproteobacteria bacterium]|nr:phosphoglycerate mutase family protein [Gammaproteobacteria bacterium]
MRNYIFIRHAHAEAGEADQLRCLSQTGKQEAQNMGKILKGKVFDLVITSSAVRTKETAKEILKQLNQTPHIAEIDEIYQPQAKEDRELIEKSLEIFKSQPLNAYLDHQLQCAWGKYAKCAFEAMLLEIELRNSTSVLVVGHGNIINAIGLHLAPKAKELSEKFFKNCEGFEIISSQLVRFFPC